MDAGVTSPTSEFWTVSAGAMVAPPMRQHDAEQRACDGASASAAMLTPTASSSQLSWRTGRRGGRRSPNAMPPIALPMPQTASSSAGEAVRVADVRRRSHRPGPRRRRLRTRSRRRRRRRATPEIRGYAAGRARWSGRGADGVSIDRIAGAARDRDRADEGERRPRPGSPCWPTRARRTPRPAAGRSRTRSRTATSPARTRCRAEPDRRAVSLIPGAADRGGERRIRRAGQDRADPDRDRRGAGVQVPRRDHERDQRGRMGDGGRDQHGRRPRPGRRSGRRSATSRRRPGRRGRRRSPAGA